MKPLRIYRSPMAKPLTVLGALEMLQLRTPREQIKEAIEADREFPDVWPRCLGWSSFVAVQALVFASQGEPVFIYHRGCLDSLVKDYALGLDMLCPEDRDPLTTITFISRLDQLRGHSKGQVLFDMGHQAIPVRDL